MTETEQKKTSGDGGSALTSVSQTPPVNGKLLSAFVEAGQQALDSAIELNQHMTSFANERLEANSRRLSDLGKCNSFEDAVGVQSEFTQKMHEAYSTEWPKLAEKTALGHMAVWSGLLDAAKLLPAETLKE